MCEPEESASVHADNNESLQSELESNSVKKIMTVFWNRGRLGAAYYNCDNSELHVLDDVVDVRPNFNLLKSLISLVEPTEVLTCRNAAEVFLTCLRSILQSTNENEDTSGTSTNLRLVPASRAELGIEACRRTVLTLRIESEALDESVEKHEMLISSLLNLQLESMVTSVALLIRYLERCLPQVMLSYGAWTVFSIHHIRLEGVVFVDEDTRRALQVFSPLQHPSAFLRGTGKPREGLSLLGLFGRCRSPDGMRRLREILATPTRDCDALNTRLDTIAFLCLPQSQQIVSSLNSSVARVRSVAGLLVIICQTHGSVSNWQNLYSSIYNAILIGRICGAHASASKLFAEIAENVSIDVHQVAHFIDKVMDFEESARKNKFSVHAGIDKNLDAKRALYSQVPNVIVKVAELELRDLPETISQCSIVCITELGYLLCVPAWLEVDADTSLYHLPDFQVKFIVNKHVYYKTPRCSELDRILGDLVAQMSRVESDIMVLLMQFIRRRMPAILKAVGLIADLDCMLAFADVARQNNFVRPELVSESRIDIIGGRHPLQELCVDRFVPNDTHFGPDRGRIKLLTGPNASGKSVYLKQVALITYLAHVGSFVPAESATIGLMDHIRTRIQTAESCSTQMSAFYIDLNQMLQCIYSSTPNSLLVIDEFGKGTTEIDGQALLLSCLDHFLARNSNCPLVLASTHFHKVPKMLTEYSHYLNLLTPQKMTYVTEGDELICLHKVEDGEAEFSFAHLAARAAGLNEDALSRSYQLLNEPTKFLLNINLKVTKHMAKTIRTMKQYFNIVENISPSIN